MKGLDTNVLIRFLINDDKRQAKRAAQYIREAISNGEFLFINHVVFCELIWVLESCYGYKRREIVIVLEKILATKQFEFENKDILRLTISMYETGKGDFSDYLIGKVNHSRGCKETASFDRTLKDAVDFKLL